MEASILKILNLILSFPSLIIFKVRYARVRGRKHIFIFPLLS